MITLLSIPVFCHEVFKVNVELYDVTAPSVVVDNTPFASATTVLVPIPDKPLILTPPLTSSLYPASVSTPIPTLPVE